MPKFLRFFIIIILLLLGLLGYKYFDTESRIGQHAPDFTTILIDNSSFTLSELQGKYVVLDFWGSWCMPCIRQNPELVALSKKYKDSMQIVSIALEKDDRTWKKAAIKAGFDWKYQIVEQNQFVLLSPLGRKYGVIEIPATFLISPSGKLLGQYSLPEIDRWLSREIDK